jgi:23S rRNA (pseudouridine1915-N3)-methyltransferase
MKLHIIAIGKIAGSPEAELVQRYAMRMATGRFTIALTELSETRPLIPPAPPQSKTVVLDERGLALPSHKLAATLDTWAVREVRFLIGGADGHSAETRAEADLLLSFGPATWPHLLVRAMLAEQLYRASTILSNHPYHRAH